jgi:RNA polymerase sigma-70 factor (ECF subfamily)
MTDLDHLLPAIADGDDTAFGQFVAAAESRIRSSLLPFATTVDIESVVQECLLRLWQVAPRVVPDGRPNAMLRLGIRIARNLAVSETRRRPGTTSTALGDDASDVEPSVEPEEPDPMLREIIARCRELLRGKPAEVLAARLGGPWRADADLAAELGMLTNTFLQNFTRARRQLAECLRRHRVDVAEELA